MSGDWILMMTLAFGFPGAWFLLMRWIFLVRPQRRRERDPQLRARRVWAIEDALGWERSEVYGVAPPPRRW